MIIKDKIGNEALLDRVKTLFLCSKHTPYNLYKRIFDWVDNLGNNDCVICFNSSELEDEVMRALLEITKEPSLCYRLCYIELKPKVREQTLKSLAFTLNKIWLDDHRAAAIPYPKLEEEDYNYSRAAEEK